MPLLPSCGDRVMVVSGKKTLMPNTPPDHLQYTMRETALMNLQGTWCTQKANKNRHTHTLTEGGDWREGGGGGRVMKTQHTLYS